ncbi:MAG TPA: hypothetical protein DDY77_05700 [Clostridiales bacterium]|nr:hypothetical protein [Clostridiales bacterium]
MLLCRIFANARFMREAIPKINFLIILYTLSDIIASTLPKLLRSKSVPNAKEATMYPLICSKVRLNARK